MKVLICTHCGERQAPERRRDTWSRRLKPGAIAKALSQASKDIDHAMETLRGSPPPCENCGESGPWAQSRVDAWSAH